uniref:Fucosyltransferase n=1 Tax=Meloidogyne javanica TaxID=6303 RepID=A0A915ND07_MELJA
MYTVECPVETLKYYDRKFLTNTFFNSSATYRLDSDVYMPHDALTKITPKTPKEYIWDQKDVLAKVKNKTKFVFQAISHCNSESGRDIITKRMSELIKLDLVGDCYGVYCDLECYNRELG